MHHTTYTYRGKARIFLMGGLLFIFLYFFVADTSFASEQPSWFIPISKELTALQSGREENGFQIHPWNREDRRKKLIEQIKAVSSTPSANRLEDMPYRMLLDTYLSQLQPQFPGDLDPDVPSSPLPAYSELMREVRVVDSGKDTTGRQLSEDEKIFRRSKLLVNLQAFIEQEKKNDLPIDKKIKYIDQLMSIYTRLLERKPIFDEVGNDVIVMGSNTSSTATSSSTVAVVTFTPTSDPKNDLQNIALKVDMSSNQDSSKNKDEESKKDNNSNINIEIKNSASKVASTPLGTNSMSDNANEKKEGGVSENKKSVVEEKRDESGNSAPQGAAGVGTPLIISVPSLVSAPPVPSSSETTSQSSQGVPQPSSPSAEISTPTPEIKSPEVSDASLTASEAHPGLSKKEHGARISRAKGISRANLERIPLGKISYEGLDSDKDGLSDQFEIAIYTRPDLADTDRDGYSDGVEIQNGYDPLTKTKSKKKFLKRNAKSFFGKVIYDTKNPDYFWYVNPLNGKRYFLGTDQILAATLLELS